MINSKDPDRDLRRLFAAARRADKTRTPAFDRLWRKAPERRKPRVTPFRLAAAGAVAALALIFALLPREGGPPTLLIDAAYDISFDWRGPTDFLLDTPGGELFSTVPHLGAMGSPSWPDLDETLLAETTDPRGG